MKRVCTICGAERETYSARAVYVCAARACQDKARVYSTGEHGHTREKKVGFFRRQKRVRALEKQRWKALRIAALTNTEPNG
jgi:hypothetical protein